MWAHVLLVCGTAMVVIDLFVAAALWMAPPDWSLVGILGGCLASVGIALRELRR